MEAVLRQINSVPGVIGSMVCDEFGTLRSQAFPPLFEREMLEEASLALVETSMGLQGGTGEVGMLDLRYSEGRILVKALPNAFLMLLCTKTVNLQLLLISLNVALKKLEKLLQAPMPAAPVPVSAPALPQPAAYQAPPIIEAVADLGLKLRVELMKSSAGTYWDQMVKVVAVNRETARQLSDHFRTGPFKRLKLTNQSTGDSQAFTSRIIADDRENKYDGKIIVSLAVAESLGARAGDPLVASISIGGGMFGWEGI